MAGRANSGHSEVDFAHLFELSSIMFCVADFSGRIVNVNQAWESQLGYRVEDLAGVEYLALVHPDDLESTRGLMRQLSGAGSVAGFINRYRSAAGEYRHIEWQATVAGDLIYASAVDVTRRERALTALRRSEARHRRLFEVTTQGVIYQDADGRILDANPAAQEILGLTMDQLSGRTSLDAKWRAIHEDGSDFPGPEHPAMIALATGCEVRDVTMGVFNPDQDRYRWVRIRAIPEQEPGTGQVQDVSITFDDISAALADRAKIEAQNASLREAIAEQTEYRAQLDSMMAAVNRHAIVSVTDLDGRITAFNDNFIKISQYTADELLGNTHRVINSGHHPKEFFAAMWETIKTGQTWQGEICNRAKDGTLYWVLSTVQPFRDARGEVVQYVSIRTDITAQKVAELAAAAANQSKSRFLATMSHEIRTPLTAIIGLSHLADDSVWSLGWQRAWPRSGPPGSTSWRCSTTSWTSPRARSPNSTCATTP